MSKSQSHFETHPKVGDIESHFGTHPKVGDIVQLIKYLSSIREALSLIHNTAKN